MEDIGMSELENAVRNIKVVKPQVRDEGATKIVKK